MTQHGPDHIETATDPSAFAGWPEGLHDEMLANRDSGMVGSVLVSETDRVRVWHLTIPAGCRCAFHRHVNPYFWSCHTNGLSRNYHSDGRIVVAEHFAGQTRHFHYGPGDYMLHSVENIGDTDLVFTTVEFLDGTNPALDIPDSARLTASALAAE
jgi:beta-alanine degradation protein BauB